MRTKLITLGRCCEIVLDTIHNKIKQESSLFDWHWTDTFAEINYILEKVCNNEEIKIHNCNGNNFMTGTNIKSAHYKPVMYSEILLRRIDRLKCNLLNSDQILFIRHDVFNNLTQDEVDMFHHIVTKFNPNLKYKLLVLSSTDNILTNIIHRKYNKDMFLSYVYECYDRDTFPSSNALMLGDKD